MSFGGGGGQVRYALIVDDQATAKLGNFKNQLNSLGSGTTTVTRNMASLNNTFSAGVTTIKNQGDALNQLTTKQKTIGSQLTSLGSAFKNNALAIGAAASSVLGLYQNYANLSSAQNNANKSATAAKAAQNNLTKAQDTLNKTISKYGANSKEAKVAQDKLTVAQERAVNKTESAKIAQDNLNQTMADFGINILPNVILAGGSFVSLLDNIGGEKGIGGLTKKFGGLKGAIGGMSSSLGMSKLGFLGMAGAIGAASIAAVELFNVLEKGAKVKALNDIITAGKATEIQLKQQIQNITELKKSWGIQLTDFFKSGPIGKAVFGDTFQHVGDEVIKSLNSQISRIEAAKPLEKLFGFITNSNLAASVKGPIIKQINEILAMYGNENNWKAGYGATSDQVAANTRKVIALGIQKLTGLLHGADIEAGLTGALKKMFENVFKSVVATVQLGNSPLTQAFALDPKPISAGLDTIGAAYKKTMSIITSHPTGTTAFSQLFNPQEAKNALQVLNGFGAPLADLKAKFLALSNAAPKIQGAWKISPDMAKYGQLLNDWGGGVLNKVTTEQAKLNVALKLGTQNYKDFVANTKAGVATASTYRAELVKWATTQGGITDATKLTTSQLEQMRKAALGDVDTIDALNKALTSAASQGFSDFVKAGEDTFKKRFKSLEIKKDFDVISKEADKFQANFIKQMDGAGFGGAKAFALKFAETPKKFIKPQDMFAFDDLINWIKANAGLPAEQFTKGLIAKWAELAPETKTKFGALLQGLPDVAGQIGTEAGTTSGTNFVTGFRKAVNTKLFPQKGTKLGPLVSQSGGFQKTPINTTSTITPQKMPVVDQRDYQKGLQLAIANADATVKIIGTTLAKIAGIQVGPPNETKYQKGLFLAIANAADTVKMINTNLQKVKTIVIPAADQSNKYQKGLFLAIANAKDTVKQIDKELKKVSGITVPSPDLHNFNSALNQMVSNAKRAAREVKSALKGGGSSGGGGTGQQGAYGGPKFAHGGVAIANKRTTATFGEAGPEAAVFLPLNSGTGLSLGGGGGSSSGDLNITNIIRLDDREILRSFRRKMGTNRFTMGP